MRRRRGGAILLLTALALAGASTVAPARSCPGVSVTGPWKRIETPLRAAAFTVDAEGRIFVGGGREIAVSLDGGCTWRTALSLAGLIPDAIDERVGSLATVGDAVVAAVSGPYVVASTDGGATWTTSTTGLDVPGEPVGLYPNETGDVVYMLVRQKVTDQSLAAAGLGEQGAGAATTVVYRSEDGGRTWTRGDVVGTEYTGPAGTGLDGGSPPGSVWDVAVDPGDPDHLLAASRGGVLESADGGRSWEVVLAEPEAEVRAVTVWRAPGGPAALAVDPSTGTLYETQRVGGAWRQRAHPQLSTEMMDQFPHAAAWAWAASGPGGEVFVSGPKGVFRTEGETLADVTPSGLAPPGGIAAGLVLVDGAPWARLLDGSALVTEAGSSPGQSERPGSSPDGGVGLPPGETIAGLPTPPVAAAPPELVPERARVELAPGESRTVAFEARLSPRPVSVDLYFVVDTTASMSGTIRGLVGGMEDIVIRLARSGVRLRAGVGAFRTYPRESDRHVVDYAYRRLRALGPVDDDLLRALYELEGAGSSGANLTALYQAATGAGQDVLPPGPSKADVAPGGGAGFRDRSLRVVMHFADTWFGTPERGDPSGYYAPGTWPGPTMGAAAAALRDAGVLHLGIALQPGAGGNGFADADVVSDMRTLSRASSSLAGARGGDCDRDGRRDLAPGEPLVCLLERDADAGRVASAVTGLVEALERRADVELVEARESGLVRTITPPVHDDVDLRAPQRLEFEVTVACRLADAGVGRTVDFDLVVAGRAAARSSLDVVCDELPAAPVAARPDPAPRVPVLPPIPVPPPPHPVPGPGPGSVTAPAPVQAPAPAQAPGGQPNAVVVAQRQQQPQVAFVTAAQQVRAQTQMQHALVRTRGRDPLAEARLWTAIGALSVVWMWGLARASVASVRSARVSR